MKTIKIAGRKIGGNNPCFIIAEAGINHNGDLDTSMKMIDVAKDCGIDAVKFQTFKAEEFVSDKKQAYMYESQGKQVTESMYEMFKRYEFNAVEFKEIAGYCLKKKIIFFSTPQNISDLELLLEIGIPAIKVGSDDLTNLPLLNNYARRNLPIIISTGMSYFSEIADAVKVIKKKNSQLAILSCVSSYPADYDEVNLKRILALQNVFPDAVIGYSDHTIGTTASVGAVSLGAKIIEKHFTLNKNMFGPDHQFSSNPDELKRLVYDIRSIERCLGNADFTPSAKEKKMRLLCRRSIVAASDLCKGAKIKRRDLVFKRPGTGILPKNINLVLGRTVKCAISKDQLIRLELLQ